MPFDLKRFYGKTRIWYRDLDRGGHGTILLMSDRYVQWLHESVTASISELLKRSDDAEDK